MLRDWQEATIPDIIDELSGEMDLTHKEVASALGGYIQAGRVVYDIERQVYQFRELAKTPLPMDQLRFTSPEESKAIALIAREALRDFSTTSTNNSTVINGKVIDGTETFRVRVVIDKNDRLQRKDSTCSCPLGRNRFAKGLCSHVLALRMEYGNRLRRKGASNESK